MGLYSAVYHLVVENEAIGLYSALYHLVVEDEAMEMFSAGLCAVIKILFCLFAMLLLPGVGRFC